MYGLGIKTNVNKSVGKNETTTLSLYQGSRFLYSPRTILTLLWILLCTCLFDHWPFFTDGDIIYQIYFSILSDYLPFSIASFNGSLALKHELRHRSKNNFYLTAKNALKSFISLHLLLPYAFELLIAKRDRVHKEFLNWIAVIPVI